MPTIRQAPRATLERWEVAVTIDGKRKWKTFDSRAEAEAYAMEHTPASSLRGSHIPRTAEEVLELLASRAKTTSTGCHVWTGPLTNAGYGQMVWRRPDVRPEWGAHRIAYVATWGEIPDRLVIDHLCRNRACVNPDHLEVVSSRENSLRSPLTVAHQNATKTHCAQGHEYTPENTRTTLTRGRPTRYCAACQRARAASRRMQAVTR